LLIDRVLRSGLEAWAREHRLVKAGLEQAERGDFASDQRLNSVRNKYRPEA
jgi:predicted transcriptional regulator